MSSNNNTTTPSSLPTNTTTMKRPPSASGLSTNTILLVIGSSTVWFLAGTMFGASFSQCSSMVASPQQNAILHLEKPQRQAKEVVSKKEGGTAQEKQSPLFPETVGKFAVNMVHVKKEDFTQVFEMGVPIDQPVPGAEDVLILYNTRKAMPKKHRKLTTITEVDGPLSVKDAVENCDFVNMIFHDFDSKRLQCTAIIPQYESFHIQRWARAPPPGTKKGTVGKEHELRMVPRGFQGNGIDAFKPPIFEKHTKRNWALLQTYLNSLDDVLAELKAIVDKIKINNTVIVMVCNHGQSELLINFACSTHARGLDISNIIVFATDEETKELAESVGLAAYYDERVRTHKVHCINCLFTIASTLLAM